MAHGSRFSSDEDEELEATAASAHRKGRAAATEEDEYGEPRKRRRRVAEEEDGDEEQHEAAGELDEDEYDDERLEQRARAGGHQRSAQVRALEAGVALAADEDADHRPSRGNDRKGDELFELIHGHSDDIQAMEAQMATYDAGAWAQLAENLLRIPVDATMSDRDLMLQFNLLYQLFCFPYKDDYAVVDRVKAIYPHVATMKEQFKKLQRVFGLIHFEMIKRNLIENETRSGREIQRMMTNTAFGMKMTFEQTVHNRMIQKCGDKSMRAMLDEMSPLAFFQEVDTSKLKKHQQLLHFYYSESFKNGYRKDGDSIYKPRHNKFGEFVYAYEYVFDISDFVFQAVFPLEQNHYWFECLTERNGNGKTCVEILTKVKCEWLPDLERNSDVHSFQNGLYLLSLDGFFYFKKLPGKHWVGELEGSGINLTAVKYHDMIFDEEGMEAEMAAQPVRTYMSIQMEPIYQVLTTQGFTMEECQWILALLGRMMHPLGKMDNWAVFLYFLGLAGTGKSSLLRLLASLFEVRDVGYLNNVLQKTFSIEGISDKLIYLALDIDEHFGLDQATFQSMVCGEEVSVLRKFKKPMTVLWKSHGGFAGNKLPPWTDNGGSLSRRLIIVEFLTAISKSDPKLFERCLSMKDRFLKVINAAYHDMTRRFASKSIKDVIPAKFRESEKKALLELNTLAAFIKENCDLETNPSQPKYFASFKDFTKAYKAYCKRNSLQAKPLNYNFYSGVFCKINCKMVESPVPATDIFRQSAAYVRGLRLKESAMEGVE